MPTAGPALPGARTVFTARDTPTLPTRTADLDHRRSPGWIGAERLSPGMLRLVGPPRVRHPAQA
jgi:hypothetical protein